MVNYDLHTHTLFSDGKNTPREMVTAALSRGMKVLGFSDHSPVPFDQSAGMAPSSVILSRRAVQDLKDQYKDLIELRFGIEQDIYSPDSTEGCDYVIGSVHYVKCGDAYHAVDQSPESLEQCVRDCFDGDWYALCEAYFAEEAQVVEKTHADIIGHFDLVTKYNEKYQWFDEHHPRYIAAWQKAADALLKTGKIFEINTGAISRSWRTVPYPAPDIIDYIKERGGKFILSSDSHIKNTLQFAFEDYEKYL